LTFNFNLSLTYIELYFLSLNILAFGLYSFDKFQAIRNSKNISRVPETRLLVLALFGGSIGALVSMISFRHKVKKLSFMWKYCVIVLLQACSYYYFIL